MSRGWSLLPLVWSLGGGVAILCAQRGWGFSSCGSLPLSACFLLPRAGFWISSGSGSVLLLPRPLFYPLIFIPYHERLQRQQGPHRR